MKKRTRQKASAANEARPALLGALACLAAVFPDESTRPSLRWLRRMQAKRLLPFYKIGGLVFFDPEEVRAAINRDFRINSIGEN